MKRIALLTDFPDAAAADVGVRFLPHFSSVRPFAEGVAAWHIIHPAGAAPLPFGESESDWREHPPESDLEFDLAVVPASAPGETAARADVIILATRADQPAPVCIADAASCSLVINAGAGAGGIDLGRARALGILVASVPDAASALCARLIADEIEARVAARPRNPGPPIRLGLVGLGSLGQAIARIAAGAGWEVWAHDPFKPPHAFESGSIRRAPLPEIAGICDAVSVQVTRCGATRGLIGADYLQFAKRSQFVVNASHPEVVDAAAAREVEVARIQQRLDEVCDSAEARGLALGRALEMAALCLCGELPGHLLLDPPLPRHVASHSGR